eukprot:TRINITY_DN91918_c0_g1_i1.p1 TRINITY_DN91918_c0_g1~~TRINITY_DN91918_c0_g1_i1.p1  ORF type:complete len:335 (-),score=48.42 TRINITY_DN91918_c0_g1_i1:173-1177(-)
MSLSTSYHLAGQPAPAFVLAGPRQSLHHAPLRVEAPVASGYEQVLERSQRAGTIQLVAAAAAAAGAAVQTAGLSSAALRRRKLAQRHASRRGSLRRSEASKLHRFSVACRSAANPESLTGLEVLPELPELSADDERKLLEGNRVQHQRCQGAEGHGFVVVDVDAPRADVLERFQRFEEFADIIPVVLKSDVVSREGASGSCTSAVVKYTVAKFLLPTLSLSVLHTIEPDVGIVRFDLDPSSRNFVLKQASGFWFVEELVSGEGGTPRCRIWFCVTVKVSSLLPSQILHYVAEKSLEDASSWMKPYFEELFSEQRSAEAGPEDGTISTVPSAALA